MPNEHDPQFFDAAGIIDKRKSGNPDQKYQSGTLRDRTDERGIYHPYIDSVIDETNANFPELKKQVQDERKAFESATFGVEKEKTQEEKDSDEE